MTSSSFAVEFLPTGLVGLVGIPKHKRKRFLKEINKINKMR